MLGREGKDQLGDEVARGIRRAVKEENPDAYLLAEHYFDATAQLQGDCWDGVMNYSGCTIPLWHWLSRFRIHQHAQPQWISSDIRWSTEALLGTWEQHRAAIPWKNAMQQFNLLGSHDTPRIASIVNRDPALVRLAMGLLLTYVGTPSLFYGDEIGLAGDSDLAARRCMPWEQHEWDNGLYEFCRRLIALRKESVALRRGGFQILMLEQDAFAYLRDASDEYVVVIAHRGPGTRPAGGLPVAHGALPDGLPMTEVLTGAATVVGDGLLPLPAVPPGITIWRNRTGPAISS
jgi:alpha-glucosidase